MSGGAVFRNSGDITRTIRGVKNTERLMLSPAMPNGWQPLSTAQTAQPATVRITGSKDSIDFTYPAVLCFINLETVPPTWYETTECLVYCADTTIDLVTDKKYAARPAYFIPDNGTTIHPGWFVFLVDGAEVSLGCGLTHDGDGNVIVDVPALVGEGMGYVTDPNTNCNVFVVNATNFNWSAVNYSTFVNNFFDSGYLDCGFWNDNGVFKLDFVTSAGHGIVGDNDTCEFRADADCHIVVGADGISVDLTTLPGTASVTGLTSGGTNCKYLTVDLTVDTTLNIPVDVHVNPGGLAMVGGMLRESFTRYNYVVFKNAAGMPIEFFLDTTEDLYNEIDPCLFEDCCNASNIAVTINVTPDSGAAPLTVNFTSTPSGGVSPYTYYWTFEEGTPPTSTAEDPGDVEFSMPGNFAWTVLVTDACGRTYSDNGTIESLDIWERDVAGTYSWTATCANAMVEVWGAGGAGGGGSNTNACGGGGGGGGYTRSYLTSLNINTNYTVVVGLGGAISLEEANGDAGGASYFDSINTVLAFGGDGGYGASGGVGGAGGAGGATGVGDITYTGGDGGSGASSDVHGGGGGSSAGSAANGNNGTAGGSGGAGGTAVTDGGAGGGGGGVGDDGTGPGGGSGGGGAGNMSGLGADGKVKITCGVVAPA